MMQRELTSPARATAPLALVDFTMKTFDDFPEPWVCYARDSVPVRAGGQGGIGLEPTIPQWNELGTAMKLRLFCYRFVDGDGVRVPGRIAQGDEDVRAICAAREVFWDRRGIQWTTNLVRPPTASDMLTPVPRVHLWVLRLPRFPSGWRPVVSLFADFDKKALMMLIDNYHPHHVNWKVYGGNTYEFLRSAGKTITYSIEDVTMTAE